MPVFNIGFYQQLQRFSIKRGQHADGIKFITNTFEPVLTLFIEMFRYWGTPDGGFGSFLLIGRLDGFPFTKARCVGVFGGPGIIENSY